MTDPQVGVLMLALFIFVIMLGFPIAFSLMAMGVGFAFYYFDFREAPVFALVVRKTFEVMTNEVLLPVPLVPVHGLCGRTRRYSESAVPQHPGRGRATSRPRWRSRLSRPARCSPPPPASSARS